MQWASNEPHVSVYDVAIAGGGPAGAALALELGKRGANVVLFEATNFDLPRFGETLAPEANPLLRRLGVWESFLAHGPLPSPGTISFWGRPVAVERDFVSNRYGNGWHLDRNAFDAMLCRCASHAGAQVRTAMRIARPRRAGDGVWQLAGENDTGFAQARFLVDASGRNGLRLTPDDGRRVDDRLIAIFVSLSPSRGASDLRTVVESTPDGWWYYAPLPSGDCVAVFFCDPELYRDERFSLDPHLAAAPQISARMCLSATRERHVVAVSSSRRTSFVGAGWAAAGDAAISYDPLSGYGLTGALTSAIALAAALEREDFDEYAAAMERRFLAYAEQRAAYYAMEERWSDNPFWRRRREAAAVSKLSH